MILSTVPWMTFADDKNITYGSVGQNVFHVRWEGTSGEAITMPDPSALKYKLCYTIDGQEAPLKDADTIGLDDLSVEFTDGGQEWRYTVNLPASYTETVDSDSQTHNLTWYFVPNLTVGGYTTNQDKVTVHDILRYNPSSDGSGTTTGGEEGSGDNDDPEETNLPDPKVEKTAVPAEDSFDDRDFVIKWDDNNNNDRAVRPTTEQITYKLYYVVDDGKPAEVDKKFLEGIGMTNAQIDATKISFDEDGNSNVVMTTTEISTWKYDPHLPSKYTETINTTTYKFTDPDNPSAGTEVDETTTETKEHTVKYYLKPAVNDDAADLIDKNYIEKDEYNDYIDERMAPGSTRTYTLTYDFNAEIDWYDNHNLHNTRPNDVLGTEKLVVYRYVEGGEPEVQENIAPVITAKINASGNEVIGVSTVTLGKVPAYDEDGNPYVYYCKLESNKAANKDLSGNVIKIDTKTSAANEDYSVLCTNTGNFATKDYELYTDGKLELTLEGKGYFSVYKTWDDIDRDGQRPECTLHLYRIPEITYTGEEGYSPVDIETIEKASPVEGYDDAPVDRAPVSGEQFVISIGGDSESPMLPIYDHMGNKYIYFVLETGLKGAYRQHIDNRDSKELESVEDVFNTVKNGNQPKYVLNGGSIVNRLENNADSNVSKKFEALAMQNMTAAVKLTLQKQVTNTETGQKEWVNAKVTDLLDKNEVEPGNGKNLSTDSVGNVYMTMDEFRSETPGFEGTGPALAEYTSAGARLHYRWIETEMKIQNSDWIPVDYDDATNKYQLVRIGDVGPGISGDDPKLTTAYFQPLQTDNRITNRLVGDTQILITKVWKNAAGENVTETKSKEITAKFHILKDGTELSVDEYEALRNKNDGIKLDDTVSDKRAVIVNYDDYNESANRLEELISGLPRYDNEGREYIYSIKEDPVDGWSSEFEVEISVVEDANKDKVLQRAYHYINGEGPGTSLVFDLRKEWLDDCDLLTRKPVILGIFKKDKDETPVVTVSLSEINDWYERVRIPTGGTVDDYYVKEILVNGVEPTYTEEDLANLKNYHDYRTLVGNLVESDSNNNKIHYNYDVLIKSQGNSATSADYTVYNRRKGVLNLNLNKKWVAGGEVLTGHFKVVQSVDGATNDVAEFDLPWEGNENITATVDGRYTVTISKSSVSDTEYNVGITGLPKYNSEGKQYEYTVVETSISQGEQEIAFDDKGLAFVEGDRYVSSVYQHDRKIKGDRYHHSGDEYYWNATNTRMESYSLEAYKVWRDEGRNNIKARPDVYFDLYRVAIPDDEYNRFINVDGKVDAESLAAFCKDNKDAQKVAGDKIWNTKHNDWCWSCDIGSVQRYDSKGNRYIYFIVEQFPNGKGEYYECYANGTVPPETKKDVESTEDVYAVPTDELDSKNVLIVSDGVSIPEEEKKTCGDYYAKTVVNVREKGRNLSGRKIWNLPAGFGMSADDMQSVTIKLYRTIQTVDKNVAADGEQLRNAVNNHLYGLKPVKNSEGEPVTAEVHSGHWQFDFEDMDKYDEFGRTYNYYMCEDGTLHMYSDAVDKISASGFEVKNTYKISDDNPRVKISASKTWNTEVNGVEVNKLKDVKFNLYAKDRTGNIVLMASKTLNPDSDGKVVTFDKFDDGVFDSQYVTGENYLPYYGPSGYPLKYWIEEEYVDGNSNGYITSKGRGTSEDSPVVFTEPAEGSKVYTGTYETGKNASVNYINTYTGDRKDFTVQKNWIDDTGRYGMTDDTYRPARINFEIYRKVGSNEEKYAEITVTKNSASFVSGWPKDNSGATISGTGWKADLNNVIKYNPNGDEYTYFVKTETFPDAKYGTIYKSEKKSNSDTEWNNTLNKVNVKVNKTWRGKKGDTTANLTSEEVETLHALGYLPDKMTFTLQRKSTGSWSDVPYSASVDKTYVEKTYDTFHSIGDIVWDNLPKYDPAGNMYSYRVKEEVGSFTHISNNDDGTVNSTVSGTMTTGYKPITGTVTVNNNNFAFTDTIDMEKFVLKKVWKDFDNRDNRRPGSVTIKVKNQAYEVAKADKTADGNIWTKEIYIPELTSEGLENIDTLLPVVEDAVANYIEGTPSFTWNTETNTGTWEVENVLSEDELLPSNDRIKVTVKPTKKFAGEDSRDNSWINDIRPVVKFELLYKDREDGTWKHINNSDAYLAVFGTSVEGFDPVKEVTITNGTGTVQWDGLLKYWTVPSVPGIAEQIEYKVVETLYKADKTTPLTDEECSYTKNDSACVGNDDNDVTTYTFDVTNTLKPISIEVEKAWNKTKNGNTSTLSLDELKVLNQIGYLPNSILFTLEKNSGGTWIKVGTDKKVPLDEFKSISGNKVKWNNLPEYNNDGTKCEYRVTETIGKFVFTANYTVGSSTSKSATMTDGFADLNGSADVTSGKVKFTNSVSTEEFILKKKWNDNQNQDNKRPAKVTYKVKNADYDIDPSTDTSVEVSENGTVWSKVIELPALESTGSYTVAETAVPGYTGKTPVWDGNTCTIENELNNKDERITVNIGALKSFAGETTKYGTWVKHERPVVKFQLYYKHRGDTDWTKVTEDNMANVGITSAEDIAKTVTITDNSGNVSWNGLLKYWSNPDNSIPDPISYKVEEVICDEDGNPINDSNIGYTEVKSNNEFAGNEDNNNNSYGTAEFTNTLKTETVSATKTWRRDDTGATLTDDDLDLLHDIGYLPDNMTFKLQKKSGTGSYTDVDDSTVTKTYTEFDEIGTITWTDLPQYDKNGNKISYRVVEKAGDFEFYSDDSDGTASGTMTAKFADVKGAVTVTGNTAAFTNTVDMSKYTLVKKWNDNSNSDGTRTADKVTFTVNGQTYEINKPDTHSDIWTLDIDLPAATDITKYTVDEQAVDGYEKTAAVWNETEGSWTIKNSTDRKTLSVDADKTFTGETVNTAYEDKDTYKKWVVANRPAVQFVLYYNHDGEWVEVTEANKADVGLAAEEAAVKTAEFDERASKSKVASWSKLYSYWSAPSTPGVPEPMSYKVVERLVLSDGTIAEDRTQYYDITDGAIYAGSKLELVNALKTTKVTAEKIWNDGDNKNRPEKIVFNLSADGTKIASLEASAATGWKAEFTDLPVMNKKGAKIKYDISEITPPGYFVSKKEVNEAGDVFKLTNSLIPPTGDVVFYKTGLMNEKCSTNGLYPVDTTVNVNGAKFELQTASGSKVATAESKDGTVKFTNVSPGTYFVKEVSAPEPYKVSDKKYKVTVSSGSVAVLYEEDGKTKVKDNTVVNDIVRADIMLTKVAESNKSMKLSGAKFGLFRDGERIATATTGSDGTLKFEGLVAGKEYRIVELEAPAGSFMSKNDITFEVDKNGKITNLYDGGGTVSCDASGNMTWKDAVTRIEIIKKDKNGTVLSGAKLAIKDKNTGKTILKFTTDGSAYDVTGVLEPGMSYIVSELSAPKGYDKADDVSFSIPMKSMAPGDNKVIKVTMTDPYDPEYFNPDGTPSYIPDDDDDLNQDGIPDKFQGDPNGNGGLFDDDENNTGDDAHANGTKTGDATDMIPYASLMFTALLEMICLLIYRRRRENN